jgi:putative transposase
MSDTSLTAVIKKSSYLNFQKTGNVGATGCLKQKKLYGLSILNFIITSNHVHLLILDRGRGEIARSMQLIAGRTAQEYNQHKKRKGAFWEDRYQQLKTSINQQLNNN